MAKKANIIVRHKYMLAFLMLTLLSLFIGGGDRLPDCNKVTYSFHILDFRIGFFSRLLPGQIYMWILKNPTYRSFWVYSMIVYYVVVVCTAYLLEKVFLRAPDEHKIAYGYIICLFCVSGIIFQIFYRSLGMHDFYWIIALVIFFLLLQNKKTWFLIPLCFAFAVMTNYGVLFCYIPLMSIILLYEAGSCTKKSERKYLLIVFSLCIVVTIILFAVLMYNEQFKNTMSKGDLHTLMQNRGSKYFKYIDYAYFRDYRTEIGGRNVIIKQFELIKSDVLPTFLKEAVNRFAYQLYLTHTLTMEIVNADPNTYKVYTCIVLIGVFYVSFYYKCLVPFYRSRKDKLMKFACFCGLALFWFAFLGGITFSNDKIRFSHNAIICIFTFFLYLMYKDEKGFGNIAAENIKKIKSLYLALFSVAAFLVRFNPLMD